MMPRLTIDGVGFYVSGVGGHFVGADECVLRLAWRIGDWLVSTVGGWRPQGRAGFERISSGCYSETAVFRVKWSDDVPEGLHSGEQLWGLGVEERDTRVAERQHYMVAAAVAGAVGAGASCDDDVLRALESLKDVDR